jgi:hypothetical protein
MMIEYEVRYLRNLGDLIQEIKRLQYICPGPSFSHAAPDELFRGPAPHNFLDGALELQ